MRVCDVAVALQARASPVRCTEQIMNGGMAGAHHRCGDCCDAACRRSVASAVDETAGAGAAHSAVLGETSNERGCRAAGVAAAGRVRD